MLVVQRLLGALLGIALLIAAFFIASLLLAVVAVATLLLWAWFAWRTRHLPRGQERGAGQVIEGEYRIEREIRRGDDPR